MIAFINGDADPEHIKQLIVDEVRRREEQFRQERKLPVLGRKSLQLQNFFKRYSPKKFSERMICLASTKSSRKTFVEWFREYCCALDSKAHDIPPGMFAPGGILYANILPWLVPIAGAALVT